jgi:hypothetical protein
MKLLRFQVLIAICILSLLSSSANFEDEEDEYEHEHEHEHEHEYEYDQIYESEVVDDGSNTCAAVFGADAAACLAVSETVQCQ